VSENLIGPSLKNNWNKATSLIELNIAGNRIVSMDNLPLTSMTRLVNLDVFSFV
jgi:hypothetical protein